MVKSTCEIIKLLVAAFICVSAILQEEADTQEILNKEIQPKKQEEGRNRSCPPLLELDSHWPAPSTLPRVLANSTVSQNVLGRSVFRCVGTRANQVK